MSNKDEPSQPPVRETISSGIPGLDDVLRGGFVRKHLYLVEGEPGSGKTTLALQFLLEGARLGEPVVYITLSETAAEMHAVAAAHGWDMAGVHILEVLPSEKVLDPQQDYTIFHPSEVELSTTTQSFMGMIEKTRPTRVVLDSLSELQLLASSSLVYRRQVLALKMFFARHGCTALLLDDRTGAGSGDGDLQVRSIAHGVVSMERVGTEYGGIRRRLELVKYRGVAFREGLHDYKIRQGGIVVYTRLVAAQTRVAVEPETFSSGLPALDALLGGGVGDGTSTLIAGPPGTGKSTLAAQFLSACVQGGQRAAAFIFEESARNYLSRADGLGLPLRPHLDKDLLLRQIDPAELTPGEFIHMVCAEADAGAKVIVIDSLNGFLHAMPSEQLLATHLHELLTYLGQRGVVTLLVGVQQGMLGGPMSTTVDASYFADNVILLRYFEAFGEIRQAISVFKKRTGQHERTLRQFLLGADGIHVGPVLRQFRGVLSGNPTYDDSKPENESPLNDR